MEQTRKSTNLKTKIIIEQTRESAAASSACNSLQHPRNNFGNNSRITNILLSSQRDISKISF